MRQIICDSCGEHIGGENHYDLCLLGPGKLKEYDICQKCVKEKLQVPGRPIIKDVKE